jgi:hypothetical protein
MTQDFWKDHPIAMTRRPAAVWVPLLVCCVLAGCGPAAVDVDRAADNRASRAAGPAHLPASASEASVPAGGGPDPAPTSQETASVSPSAGMSLDGLGATPETTAPADDAMSAFESGRVIAVTVHFVRRWGGRLYLVPERRQAGSGQVAVESAARLALTVKPTWAGATNPFPAGTRLLGVALLDGTATVDLSSEVLAWHGTAEEARYSAQALACTLASAGPVERVRVRVEGRSAGVLDGHDIAKLWDGLAVTRPLTPDPTVRLAPIVLSNPRPGLRVADGRLLIQGEASTGQGTVSLRLRDADGQVVAQNFTTAEEKAPKRGPFSAALTFTPPRVAAAWTLEVFEADPGDGTITYQVKVPINVGG